MPSKAFVEFINDHYKNTQGLRLGQRFYNLYIARGPWPELYYGDDKSTCHIIRKWLDDHQYFDELPPVIRTFEQ